MTPKEAMSSKFALSLPENDRPTLRLLLDAVDISAKASETRRCIDYIKSCRVTDGKVFDLRLLTISEDLLRTGGLMP